MIHAKYSIRAAKQYNQVCSIFATRKYSYEILCCQQYRPPFKANRSNKEHQRLLDISLLKDQFEFSGCTRFPFLYFALS